MTRAALCFPGQGSQRPGMADDLLDHPAARPYLEAAEADGLDLASALRSDDPAALRPTEIAQPALLLAGGVLAEIAAGGLEVVGVAGHSVGEYAALVAAGVLDAGAATHLVIARGRAMAAMREGTMAALLGASDEVAAEVCAAVEAEGTGTVVVANHNAPGQVVLSGEGPAVERAVALARERGVRRSIPLNVSGAFHSPLMQAASRRFAASLDAAPLRDARIPVVCNVDGNPAVEAEAIRDRLRRQLVSPVLWTACVDGLVALGAEALVELGPSGVLTGLARRIAPGVRAVSVESPAAAAGLIAELAGVASG